MCIRDRLIPHRPAVLVFARIISTDLLAHKQKQIYNREVEIRKVQAVSKDTADTMTQRQKDRQGEPDLLSSELSKLAANLKREIKMCIRDRF